MQSHYKFGYAILPIHKRSNLIVDPTVLLSPDQVLLVGVIFWCVLLNLVGWVHICMRIWQMRKASWGLCRCTLKNGNQHLGMQSSLLASAYIPPKKERTFWHNCDWRGKHQPVLASKMNTEEQTCRKILFLKHLHADKGMCVGIWKTEKWRLLT